MDSRMQTPRALIGTWRRFGPLGPVYEVLSAGRALDGGDQFMHIRVVESGEEVDYHLSDILEVPRDR